MRKLERLVSWWRPKLRRKRGNELSYVTRDVGGGWHRVRYVNRPGDNTLNVSLRQSLFYKSASNVLCDRSDSKDDSYFPAFLPSLLFHILQSFLPLHSFLIFPLSLPLTSLRFLGVPSFVFLLSHILVSSSLPSILQPSINLSFTSFSPYIPFYSTISSFYPVVFFLFRYKSHPPFTLNLPSYIPPSFSSPPPFIPPSSLFLADLSISSRLMPSGVS